MYPGVPLLYLLYKKDYSIVFTQEIKGVLRLGIREIITFIGVLITCIVSSISLIINVKDSRENRYANTIIGVREEWLSNLRLYISEFIKSSIRCLNEKDKNKLVEHYSDMIKYAYISRTHLGVKYELVCKEITEVENYISTCCGEVLGACKSGETSISNTEDFYEKIKQIESDVLNCFNMEWKRMRSEAKGK